ncbi:MAG: hypothetical protein ACLFOA_07875 [Desulfohalobiaceae bacterium]
MSTQLPKCSTGGIPRLEQTSFSPGPACSAALACSRPALAMNIRT